MTGLLIVLLWVICAIASAYFAAVKGRNMGAWFFCGLVFGVFGLVAAVLAHPEEDLYRRPERNW